MSRWDIFRWRTLAGGRWCPVGTVQRRPRRQARVPSKGGRRGQLRYRPGKAQATRGCQAVSLAFFPALRAYKVKGKVETFLKKSFIKKLYARFARHSAARTSHCIYTMRNSGWLNSTTWPLPTQISATVPSSSAGISFISFMASMMHSVSPFFTWSPTSTKGRASGLGAE